MRITVGILTVLLFSLVSISCEMSGASGTREKIRLPDKLKYPSKKTDNPKIIAFGDSLTAGFGLSERESYPFLLQQKLNSDGFDYEVINAGVSGDTSLGGLERVDWVLGQENVKVLILELGANDLLRGVPVARIRRNLEQIITKAKSKNIEIVFCGMLAPETMGEKYRREFTNTFPELATKYDLVFVPFLLDGVALKKELNQPDGIHPNAKGTVIMTDNIYKELKPLLQKLSKNESESNASSKM